MLIAKPNAMILTLRWPRAEAAAGFAAELHPSIYARAEPTGADQRHRRRRRLPELSGRLRTAARERSDDRAHRLQPVYSAAEAGAGGFRTLDRHAEAGAGTDFYRANGAGEMLVFSAADFEDFLQPRPDLPQGMEDELERVVRHLVEHRWPFRLHATYDESISRMLDVFEKVNRDIPFNGLHWFFDHAETITERNIERVKALGRYCGAASDGLRANILSIATAKRR